MRKILKAFLFGSMCMSLAIPAMAADFTDGETEQPSQTQIEAEEFTPGAEETFSSGDTGGESLFEAADTGSETEGQELVYEYLPEQDAYRVIKGVDQEIVQIPESYEGKPVAEIGEGAFAGFQNLGDIWVNGRGKQITIRKGAFENCEYLRGVYLAGGGTIESGAFWGCPRLTGITDGSMNWKNMNIADDAFDPDSKVIVSTIGQPYEERPYFVLDMEGGLLWDEGGVLYWDTMDRVVDFFNDRENVTVSHDLWAATIIGRKSFYGADKMKTLTILPGIETIETKAFYGCVNLTAVNIPDSVTEIAEDAFDSCPKVSFYTTKGSYAEAYARQHGIPVSYIPKEPHIDQVTVYNNMITVDVSGFSGDAYYCVLGTRMGENGVPVRENGGRIAVGQTGRKVVFRNVPEGNYYIAARALTVNGTEKNYSVWSNVEDADISVETPKRPRITNAKVSGKNLSVTVDVINPKRILAYNLVLAKGQKLSDSSTAAAAVPVNPVRRIQDSKKKNVSLKNLKAGTYYLGIQTYRIEDGNRIYSQWSPLKKIVIR